MVDAGNVSGVFSYASFGMTASYLGLMVGICVFLGVILIIFLVSKNFRNFIYGSVVSIAFLINFAFSKWVGTSFNSGNTSPFKYTLYTFIFVLASIFFGMLIRKTKWIAKKEKEWF